MQNTLFVVDDDDPAGLPGLNTIGFDTYLRDYPKFNEPKMRIINLCDTERYLSQGYYCSLLAEARQHQVIPSIKVINALRDGGSSLWLDSALLGKKSDTPLPQQPVVICMGEVADSRYRKLAAQVFQAFPAPLLAVEVSREKNGAIVSVSRCALAELAEQDKTFCLKVLSEQALKSWRTRGSGKKFRWDMALLVDPNEKVPPSNSGAITRFIKAGEKLGIRVQTVTTGGLRYLNQYDALFIRQTTAINHPTYRLAREAEEQGLVVIDDPDSILRCCNKVYLHDAFNYQKVPSLRTQFLRDIEDKTLDRLESEFQYPMVLKMPEGSFSKGVFKAADRAELQQIGARLLSDSALVLAQEYLFTEFDWRIGVLNGRALYACRYYMARNHWQIYNHDSKRHFSGGFDAIPTFELPASVLNAALKAAAVVGNGLYGIDIKTVEGRAYVLEVNDNPSIDHGIEDAYIGEELYMLIMSEFLRRLEMRGR